MPCMDTGYSVTEIPVKTCRRGHLKTPDNLVSNGKHMVCRICRKESLDRASLKYRRTHGIEEGNANARKTHCDKGHEFTEENTYWCGPDGTRRQCKTCRNANGRASYQRHRDKRVAEQRARYAADPESYRERERR